MIHFDHRVIVERRHASFSEACSCSLLYARRNITDGLRENTRINSRLKYLEAGSANGRVEVRSAANISALQTVSCATSRSACYLPRY